MSAAAARRNWSDFAWPEWVPAKVREEIERFWDDASRGPDAWEHNAAEPYNHGPPFGEHVRMRRTLGRPSDGFLTGRFVHAWNNMGRLVLDDGSVEVVASAPGSWALESDPLILHVCLDVRGLLRRHIRDLWNALDIEIEGRRFDKAADLREALFDELAKGRLVLPVGAACDGFDYRTGCPSHFASRSGS